MKQRRMVFPCAFVLVVALPLGIASLAAARNARPQASARLPSDEASFLAENEAAMTKMMHAMAVTPTGDVDKDFAATMIPHHQGAIDMAQAELRYGKNEQLRRIAQEIVIDQLQEISAMRLALGQPLPPGIAAPTRPDQTNPSRIPD